MSLSIVTSLYYSTGYLEEFHRRISACAARIAEDYEIILVNDGSPDASLDEALRLLRRDAKITVVDLSRNFGHHKALMAGLKHASGDYVFLIDVDLEEPPELLEEFWKELHAVPGVDVVYGVQQHRKGGWFERLSGRLFYGIMGLFGDIDYPADTLTARLMTRSYVDALKRFDDRQYDLWMNFALAGFRQTPVIAAKTSKGSSHYTLCRKIRHAVESVTSSSSVPLYLIFMLGLVIFGISCLYVVLLFIQKIIFDVPAGWSALAASIWGLGGVVMMSLGIVGIYLAKVFIETKKRPDVIIRRVYSSDDDAASKNTKTSGVSSHG